MKRRTKIVCTLGPAVDSKEKIEKLASAGMNVARLNCSHGDWESKRKWIGWIREINRDFAPIGILADLQGPKFRIGDFPSNQLELTPGQTVTLGAEGADIPVNAEEILKALTAGDKVLFGDGAIEIKATSVKGDIAKCTVVSGGHLKSRQGLTIAGKAFDVPILTEKDKLDLYEAALAGVDFIALSYVRRATDMRELRRIVDQYDPTIKLCAKIEHREALTDLNSIVKVTDVVMVARGDLGLQIDIEEVPIAQKKIIACCVEAGKPVITATQMLESMVANPRPTRAEATDVANAILDGTDAVMLSGETAVGAYPIETVRTMARIAERAETSVDYHARLFEKQTHTDEASTEAVAHSAAYLATLLKAKAIITTTSSGQTPRLVSKFRAKPPILCVAWTQKTQAQMSVVWGVSAMYVSAPSNTDHGVAAAIDALLSAKALKVGDRVVVTAGVPAGVPGNTNLILVETVR